MHPAVRWLTLPGLLWLLTSAPLAAGTEPSRDTDWLRGVAPEVERVTDWIVRQTEKTKKPGAPEYGLMPPGVSADWCRFAYRFFNDAQYYHGLEMAGEALADVSPVPS